MHLETKVLQWIKPNTFEFGIRKIRKLDDGDAIFKLIFTSICGSDLRIMKFGDDRVSPQRVLGHEMVAEVISPGLRQDLKEKDLVAIGADIPCGRCFFCKLGKSNLCETHLAFGYQIDGGFAQHLIVPSSILEYAPIVKLATVHDPSVYALAEPTGCAINGLTYSNVTQTDSVLIYGGGPIGLILALLSHNHYRVPITSILIVEPNLARRIAIKEFGIDVIAPEDAELIKTKFPYGASKVFTATSATSSHLLALNNVQKGGSVNFFGGVPKDSKALEIMANDLHYREVSIGGSHGSKPRDHENAVQVIGNNLKVWESLITLKIPVEYYEEAIIAVQSASHLKVGFTFDE